MMASLKQYNNVMLWDNPNLQRISLIKEINNKMTNMVHLSFLGKFPGHIMPNTVALFPVGLPVRDQLP